MTECQLAPSVSETGLLALSSAASQPVVSEVRTVSSDVPMIYGRRVHFLEPVLKSNPSVSFVSRPTDNLGQFHGDDKEIVRRRKKSRPLAQIEPLAVTSLCQNSHVQNNDSQTQSIKPSIEIRLRRPMSLHDVSGEVTATKLEQLCKDIEKFNAKPASSPAVRRLNRWHLAKKLTRFASSPNLFNESENRKIEVGVVDPLSRIPTTNTDSSTSPKSSPESRKPASEFFNRFMKKRTKTLASRKPLHIEIFKPPSLEESQTQDSGEGDNGEMIELENLKNEKSTKVVAEVHACENLDTAKSEIQTENNSSSSLPSSRRSSNSSNSEHKIRVQLLLHFTSQLPPAPGNWKPYCLIKDATNVHPIKEGEVLVTDILSNKMILFDSQGMPKVSFALDEASEPWASCLTSDGTLAVTLRRLGCVSLWSLSGTPLSEFGHGILVAPTGIQVDSQDRFVVADEKSNKVSIFNRQGQFVLSFARPQMQFPSSTTATTTTTTTTTTTPTAMDIEDFHFNQPRYVCITNDGHYAVTDSANHCVRIFDPNGNFCHRIGSFGKRDGQFRFPYGIACDNAGLVYVADHFNNRISVFTTTGEFQFHALTSQDGITRPKGLVIHNFHLYVTYGNLRAGKISVYSISSRQYS